MVEDKKVSTFALAFKTRAMLFARFVGNNEKQKMFLNFFWFFLAGVKYLFYLCDAKKINIINLRQVGLFCFATREQNETNCFRDRRLSL